MKEFEKNWPLLTPVQNLLTPILTPIQSSSSATFWRYDLEQGIYTLLEAYAGLSVDCIDLI